MKILGIDPGTARLGYALVTDANEILCCGIVQTNKDKAEAKRLVEIRQDLIQIIEKFKPDVVSVEKLFFFKNLKTVIPVAQARGVILEVAASYDIPIFEYTPLQIKQIIAGQGRADKQLVHDILKKEFALEEDIKPDDAADAVAIAVSYLRLDHQTHLQSL